MKDNNFVQFKSNSMNSFVLRVKSVNNKHGWNNIWANRRFLNVNPILPKLDGLLEVHTMGCIIRPIVAQYKLSQGLFW